ncbi:MAG: UDP-N-acetylmuramoyl-tripeptide--D-alanyl-D-alanine ligase [Bdellovibrionales bacterium]|nr:UDP-N-acetylmuramoyl-tripeptide--D-alanyl-D-alanine ligase [Bdellovibrionales bacterium]
MKPGSSDFQKFFEAVHRARAFTSDSRNFAPGDIFVALKGETSDGHRYVKAVLEQKPTLVLVQKGWSAENHVQSDLILEVDNPHSAHRAVAGLFRRKFQGRVIAVGGSSGKTSTKEFLATILATRFKTVKTLKSQNGELGIPKTLEQLHPDVECAVVEVGIDAPGDMARHAELVQPDIALLTSIGEEHLNLLKSVENVFKEERILFDVTLKRGGICFAPGSDPWLRRFAGTENVILTPADPTLQSTKAAQRLRERLPNAYAIQNATLALGVAQQLGLKEAEVLAAIDRLELPEGRGNLQMLPSGLLLVADHYNSNPSSLRAGVGSAAQLARQHKKPLHLILGDMLDLGDVTASAHESVVADIVGAQPATLTLVGPEFGRLAPRFREKISQVKDFPDSATAAESLDVSALAESVVLLKGSRGMRLEKVLEAVQARI